VNSLSFASSVGSPEIQVADLIAGVAREAFQQRVKPPEERDEIFEAFEIMVQGDMIDGVMAAYLGGVTEGAGLVLPGTNVAVTMAAMMNRNYVKPPPRT
jgi:hypothetical protein